MEHKRSLPYSQQPALVPILSQMNSLLASPSLMFNTAFKNVFISSATNYVVCLLQSFKQRVQSKYSPRHDNILKSF